jgi:hypothetical protein
MAAGDWLLFLYWLQSVDGAKIDEIPHIIYGEIIPQITEQIYTIDSLKATEAAVHEHREQAQNPFQVFGIRLPPPPDFREEDTP